MLALVKGDVDLKKTFWVLVTIGMIVLSLFILYIFGAKNYETKSLKVIKEINRAIYNQDFDAFDKYMKEDSLVVVSREYLYSEMKTGLQKQCEKEKCLIGLDGIHGSMYYYLQQAVTYDAYFEVFDVDNNVKNELHIQVILHTSKGETKISVIEITCTDQEFIEELFGVSSDE